MRTQEKNGRYHAKRRLTFNVASANRADDDAAGILGREILGCQKLIGDYPDLTE